MAFERIAGITLAPTGHIYVDWETVGLENGTLTVLSPVVRSVSYEPGQDVSREDPQIQALAAEAWTPELLAERDALAQEQAKETEREREVFAKAIAVEDEAETRRLDDKLNALLATKAPGIQRLVVGKAE